MTAKKLNKLCKDNQVVNTGYFVYIGYEEKWKQGIYHNVKTEYYVSSLGRVYNKKKNTFGKIFINGSGYLYCQSYYKGKRTSILINRLVLESFVGYPKNMKEPQADHIRSDKIWDNSIYNLQWLSITDNLAKRKLSNQQESDNSNVKYKVEDIIQIAELLKSGKYSVSEISSMLNIPQTTIQNIKHKRRWKHTLKNYDFSNVPHKRVYKSNSYSKSQIIQVADLLKENSKSMIEISKITNVPYHTISSIKNKKTHTELLKDYDFSNYTAGKNVFTNNQIEKIDKLIKAGYNPREICSKLNIGYNKRIRNAIYERKRKINNK